MLRVSKRFHVMREHDEKTLYFLTVHNAGALCLHIRTQNALFFVRFFLNVYLYAKCAWKKNNMEGKRRKRLAVAFSDRMRAPNSQFPPLAAHRRFPDQRRRKTKRQKRDEKKKQKKNEIKYPTTSVAVCVCSLYQ